MSGFSEIVGNDGAKSLLSHSLRSGRIGHAYIIEGPRGIGRMMLAKAFAGELLKTEKPESHPDFSVVTNQLYDPSKKQEAVLVDTIRAMKKDVYIRPYAGGRKVYVIPKADTMLATAQNSLLKVFEEPPAYCTILLLAENANSFLPTILSRAQVLRLHPLTVEQVAEYMTEKRGLPREKAVALAVMSGGTIGKALQLMEDETAAELREELFSGLERLVDGTNRDLYDLVRFLKQNRGQIDFLMEVLLSWSGDLLHYKLCGDAKAVMNGDKIPLLQKFCSRVSRPAISRFGEITVKYGSMIKRNANYPIAILCMVTEYWEEIHGRNYRS